MPSRWVVEAWDAQPGRLDPDAVMAAPPAGGFALLHGAGRYVILAEDPLAHLEASELAGLAWERTGEAPPIRPDLLALVTYEHGYRQDRALPAPHPTEDPLPDLRLALYRRVTVADRATGRVHRAERSSPRTLEPAPHALGAGAFRAREVHGTETRDSYAAKVARIRETIVQGRVYQVNLTRQETWACEGSLAELARRLHAANPAPYSAVIADPAFTVISSSPECLLSWGGGRLLTRPIKGTAPRGSGAEADARLAAGLRASAKDRGELAMIVDLVRNDLARVCAIPSVRVDAFPLLESFANVHHLVAEVSGALPGRPRLEDLLAALLPGGSVTGCPKVAAMALIRELEPAPRRIYCGALGWISHELAEGVWALPIRTAWVHGGALRFGVGGGVVWDSDPAAEYAETVHKGRSLVACLSS